VARPTYTDRYVTVRGLRLHYVDYGGDGPVVVSIPGLIQNAHAFDGIAPLLVPHFHLLALDKPGRGESEWGAASSYQYGEYLLDLTAFLGALNLGRVSLIGTSVGGTVARLFATAHPLRVTRLVLNDCAIGGNLAALCKVATRAARAPSEFADLSEALDWFLSERNGLERLDEQTRTRWVSHFLRHAPEGGLRFNCDPLIIQVAVQWARQLPAQVGSPAALSRREVQWKQAKRLTMPVLLLRGSRSKVVPPEVVRRFLHVVPSARCVEVAEVGHCPTLYEAEVQEALVDFFGVPSSNRPEFVSAGSSREQTKTAEEEANP
jgi:esterase